MAELSPAAQAVMDAFLSEWDVYAVDNARYGMAAALRAVADQVVPEPSDLDKAILSIAALRLRWVIRDQFFAIAAELDGVNNTKEND